MQVLVTGASGAIGKPLSEFLVRRGHAIRRLDRIPAVEIGAEVEIGARAGGEGDSDGDGEICADIADHGAVLKACEGIDAIVHLAAIPDDARFEDLVRPNVIGLFNVLDAARRQAVRRVVLASSVQVAWHRDFSERRTARHAEPLNHYALTKVWAEQMGEMYARMFPPMSIIAARIGWMVRDLREAVRMREEAMTRHYVSRRDVSHFLACAIEAPVAGFRTLYAIGPEGREAYDLEAAASAIGYAPQDIFPAGLPFEPPPPPSFSDR